MNERIELIHPAGKKAVTMDTHKYQTVRDALVRRLKNQGVSTHSEILNGINDDFAKNKTRFDGSVEWHMEWVKLDLEARRTIRRVGSSPVRFSLV
jgi:hypothetical protein